jgi:hypothetical protein
MAIYLNTQTNEYPRHDGDLELLGWKLGEPLPENWVEVTQDDIPEIQDGQTYEIQPPSLIDDVWHITWLVRDLTEEEKVEIQERLLEQNKE